MEAMGDLCGHLKDLSPTESHCSGLRGKEHGKEERIGDFFYSEKKKEVGKVKKICKSHAPYFLRVLYFIGAFCRNYGRLHGQPAAIIIGQKVTTRTAQRVFHVTQNFPAGQRLSVRKHIIPDCCPVRMSGSVGIRVT